MHPVVSLEIPNICILNMVTFLFIRYLSEAEGFFCEHPCVFDRSTFGCVAPSAD